MSKTTITNINGVRAGDKVTFRTKATRFMFAGETFTATAVDWKGDLYVLGQYLWAPEIVFISAERDMPDLPTEPGAYADKDGDVWLLDGNGYWCDVHGNWRRADGIVQRDAPFTRLIPETELVKQRKKIANSLRNGPYWFGMPQGMTNQDRKDIQWVIDEEIAPRIERGEF